jgi:hypothetical protein
VLVLKLKLLVSKGLLLLGRELLGRAGHHGRQRRRRRGSGRSLNHSRTLLMLLLRLVLMVMA